MFKFLKNLYICFFWRVSRKILLILRNENYSKKKYNGEFWVINEIIKLNPSDVDGVYFDVGAFKGEWTYNLKKILGAEFLKNQIYLFEPSPYAYSFLKKEMSKFTNLNIQNVALSSSRSKTPFFYNESLDGTNSFSNSHFIESDLSKKKIFIKTYSIDEFVSRKGLKKVNYIKCDVEGFDLEVIKGAEKCFDDEKINFFQFEYNHRWINNRSFLKDVFNFFDKKNYKIGKICSNKIKIISSWHPELENFTESNYLILNQNFLKNSFCSSVKFNKYNVMIYE